MWYWYYFDSFFKTHEHLITDSLLSRFNYFMNYVIDWLINWLWSVGYTGQHRGSWWTKKCTCGWTSWSSTSDRWRTVCGVKRIDASRSKPKFCDYVTLIRDCKVNLKQPPNSWSASPIGFSKQSNDPESFSSSTCYSFFCFFFVFE